MRLLVLAGVLFLGLAAPTARTQAEYPPEDCRRYAPPAHDFRGTITAHAGQPYVCVVPLIGGAILTASGGTAPQIGGFGRAVFRIIGAGLDSPGGITIVASASKSHVLNGPETETRLNDYATVTLPRGTVMARYDPASATWLPVPDGRILWAGMYKIVRKGYPFTVQPLPPAQPATLPATGGQPLAVPLALGIVLVVPGFGLLGARLTGRKNRRTHAGGYRLGVTLAAGGAALVIVSVAAYAYLTSTHTPGGFGSLEAAGATARGSGAAAPPARLVIARVKIDTSVMPIGITGGAWRLPTYSAGYLQGTALPGHAGNEAIAGHDDRDGSVFRRLGDLRAGDVAQVYAANRVYRYAVTALRVVPPTQTAVLRATGGATLTLITCTPYLVDTQRLVVRASLLP